MDLHRDGPHHGRIELASSRREQLIDITTPVIRFVAESRLGHGLLNLYAQGATAAIMIQENWDDSVPEDAVDLLRRLIPQGVWRHDAQDGNGDAHLKAGLVGPSETIPVIDTRPALSRWQGIFFCEFDGPRRRRTIQLTLLPLPP